jgi:hypothetical protein
MNPIETHSYKNWKIEIYQKQPGSFGYHCYGSNGEECRNEGYDKTQYAVEAAQNYIDEQIGVNGTFVPTKEVGSPTEGDVSPSEDLNDL